MLGNPTPSVNSLSFKSLICLCRLLTIPSHFDSEVILELGEVAKSRSVPNSHLTLSRSFLNFYSPLCFPHFLQLCFGGRSSRTFRALVTLGKKGKDPFPAGAFPNGLLWVGDWGSPKYVFISLSYSSRYSLFSLSIC